MSAVILRDHDPGHILVTGLGNFDIRDDLRLLGRYDSGARGWVVPADRKANVLHVCERRQKPCIDETTSNRLDRAPESRPPAVGPLPECRSCGQPYPRERRAPRTCTDCGRPLILVTHRPDLLPSQRQEGPRHV